MRDICQIKVMRKVSQALEYLNGGTVEVVIPVPDLWRGQGTLSLKGRCLELPLVDCLPTAYTRLRDAAKAPGLERSTARRKVLEMTTKLNMSREVP